MNELEKLLAEYRAARLKYPNVRREIEDRLLGAIVARMQGTVSVSDARQSIEVLAESVADLKARVLALEEEMQRRRGGRPKAAEAEAA